MTPTVTLLWSTYVGGSDDDYGRDVAIDADDNVLLGGYTESSDLVEANNTSSGSKDAFAAKIDADGTLLWSTYLGGGGSDEGYGIAVDSNGNALVAGYTSSSDFTGTTSDPYLYDDAFVAKIDADGELVWAQYFGGSSLEHAHDIAIDGDDHAVIVGFTYSTDLPAATNSADDCDDAFVICIDTNGTALWSTYVGGSSYDAANGVAVDADGDILLTGLTTSSVFGGQSNSLDGGQGGFVAKVGNDGGARLESHARRRCPR